MPWWKVLFVSVAIQRRGCGLEDGEEFKIDLLDIERKQYGLGNCAYVVVSRKPDGRYAVTEVDRKGDDQ